MFFLCFVLSLLFLLFFRQKVMSDSSSGNVWIWTLCVPLLCGTYVVKLFSLLVVLIVLSIMYAFSKCKRCIIRKVNNDIYYIIQHICQRLRQLYWIIEVIQQTISLTHRKVMLLSEVVMYFTLCMRLFVPDMGFMSIRGEILDNITLLVCAHHA